MGGHLEEAGVRPPGAPLGFPPQPVSLGLRRSPEDSSGSGGCHGSSFGLNPEEPKPQQCGLGRRGELRASSPPSVAAPKFLNTNNAAPLGGPLPGGGAAAPVPAVGGQGCPRASPLPCNNRRLPSSDWLPACGFFIEPWPPWDGGRGATVLRWTRVCGRLNSNRSRETRQDWSLGAFNYPLILTCLEKEFFM